MHSTISIIVNDRRTKSIANHNLTPQGLSISFENIIKKIYLKSLDLQIIHYDLVDDNYIYFILLRKLSPEKACTAFRMWQEYLHGLSNREAFVLRNRHILDIFTYLEEQLQNNKKFYYLQCCQYLKKHQLQSFFDEYKKIILKESTELSFNFLSLWSHKLSLDTSNPFDKQNVYQKSNKNEYEIIYSILKEISQTDILENIALVIPNHVSIEDMRRKIRIYDLLLHGQDASYQARFFSSYYDMEQCRNLLQKIRQVKRTTSIEIKEFISSLQALAQEQNLNMSFLIEITDSLLNAYKFSNQNMYLSIYEWTNIWECHLRSNKHSHHIYLYHIQDKPLYHYCWHKLFFLCEEKTYASFHRILNLRYETSDIYTLNRYKNLIFKDFFLLNTSSDQQSLSPKNKDYPNEDRSFIYSNILKTSNKFLITDILDKIACPHRFILKRRILQQNNTLKAISLYTVKKIITRFWHKYQLFTNLIQLNEQQLKQEIFDNIDNYFKEQKFDFTSKIQEDLDKKWVFFQCYKWLSYERTRDNFTFVSGPQYINYQNKRLKIDRVDYIPEAGCKIYIYYTSSSKIFLDIKRNLHIFNAFLDENLLGIALLNENSAKLHILPKNLIIDPIALVDLLDIKVIQSNNKQTLYTEDNIAKPSKNNCKSCQVAFICKHKFL